MKVVAFNGSPRIAGNTSLLIKEVFQELENEGIETELINVGTKKVQGCVACYRCFEAKNNKCVISNDPLNGYIDKMIEADGIILGSPVYCADITSQLKAFIDRASFIGKANDYLYKRKVGAAVVSVRRNGAYHAFSTINAFFTVEQMIVVGSSYWNMAIGRNIGEIQQDEKDKDHA